jgi:hypothetical protein
MSLKSVLTATVDMYDDDFVLEKLTEYQTMGEVGFAQDLNKFLIQENPTMVGGRCNQSESKQWWRAAGIQYIRKCMREYKNVRLDLKRVLGGYKCMHFESNGAFRSETMSPTGVTDPFAMELFTGYLDCGDFFDHYCDEVWEYCARFADLWDSTEPLCYWDELIDAQEMGTDPFDYKEHLQDCVKPSPWAVQAVAHGKHYNQIRARQARVQQSVWAAEAEALQMKFKQEQIDYRRSL